MKIKIIGRESSNKNKLFKNITKVIKEMKGKVEIEMVTDEDKIKKHNISNTPALVINDTLVSQGRILSEREIRNYIRVVTSTLEQTG